MIGSNFASVQSSSIAFADIDGDADQDLLITGQDKSFNAITKLYTNDGTGIYDEKINIPFDNVDYSSVAFADIDGDSDQDLVITGHRNDNFQIARLYLNDGLGNYTGAINTPFDKVKSGAIAFADIDADLDQDLLITGIDDTETLVANLYINNGEGLFTKMPNSPFTGVRLGSIAFADIDGDLDQDVLITGYVNSNSSISKLYINDGLGNYSALLDTPFVEVRSSSVAFADVNGNSHQDVLITGYDISASPVSKLYINDGLGNFSEEPDTPFDGVAFCSVNFLDIDNDGDNDVIINGFKDAETTIAKLYINDGLGKFVEFLETPFKGSMNGSVAYADVNGDSNKDILFTGANIDGFSTSTLYLNNGNISIVKDHKAELPFDFIVFPNPSITDQLNISYTSEKFEQFTVSIFNTNGQLVKVYKKQAYIGENSYSIDISFMQEGGYFIQLNTQNKKGAQSFLVR